MDFETMERLADTCGDIFIYGSEENRAKARREHLKIDMRERLADACGDIFIYGAEKNEKKNDPISEKGDKTMGYYTYYDFSVHDYGPACRSKADMNRQIAKVIKNAYDATPDGECRAFYPLVEDSAASGSRALDIYIKNSIDEDMHIEPFDEHKWYDSDDEMLTLSKTFRDVTFKLRGKGEERDDVWESYYKNGMSCAYHAKAKMPKFDPADLSYPEPGPGDNDDDGYYGED